ncbi:MAG TPA: helix-turn-helix domain-containing protein, partial [Pirellulaceae bacterium]|nr:helix-turn-helix domain-containing protein [Pirellulaceae bacterium]
MVESIHSSPAARRKPGRPKDAARTARRSAEILDAATAIFAERGYAATDLQLVAARLGVGKGTV